jgi:heat shock protein HslJ
MACPKLDLERRVLQVLDGAARADATHLTLVLKDAAGLTLVTLQRRDFD